MWQDIAPGVGTQTMKVGFRHDFTRCRVVKHGGGFFAEMLGHKANNNPRKGKNCPKTEVVFTWCFGLVAGDRRLGR